MSIVICLLVCSGNDYSNKAVQTNAAYLSQHAFLELTFRTINTTVIDPI